MSSEEDDGSQAHFPILLPGLGDRIAVVRSFSTLTTMQPTGFRSTEMNEANA